MNCIIEVDPCSYYNAYRSSFYYKWKLVRTGNGFERITITRGEADTPAKALQKAMKAYEKYKKENDIDDVCY